ncbi:hypothetical protein DOT66_16650 [Ralstonia pseudosolanacearum]|nr:hypothetical protein DOT66_16650 [Ralstonia pseudosolanacearum]
MRISYSEYFVHLISATDFLLEKDMWKAGEFKEALHNALRFSEAMDGKANFSYLRQLRNSIVHRGLDVTREAKFHEGFPVVISPSPVTNESGSEKYLSFARILLQKICLCEAAIGPTIADHLDALGFLEPTMSQEEMTNLAQERIRESTIVPPWAKEEAQRGVTLIDQIEVQRQHARELEDLLRTNALDQIATHESVPFFEITTWPV